jgi:ABC-type branched-subunit amino acid transport system ATPase component
MIVHEVGPDLFACRAKRPQSAFGFTQGYVLEPGRNRLTGTGQQLLGSPDMRRLYLGG